MSSCGRYVAIEHVSSKRAVLQKLTQPTLYFLSMRVQFLIHFSANPSHGPSERLVKQFGGQVHQGGKFSKSTLNVIGKVSALKRKFLPESVLEDRTAINWSFPHVSFIGLSCSEI